MSLRQVTYFQDGENQLLDYIGTCNETILKWLCINEWLSFFLQIVMANELHRLIKHYHTFCLHLTACLN